MGVTPAAAHIYTGGQAHGRSLSRHDGPMNSESVTPAPPAPSGAPLPPPASATVPDSRARRVRTARIIAIAADVVQLAFFPAFVGGWVSPINNALDVAVAIVMVRLVGWHFAFLPTFVAEMVPGVDLVPTWTMAVWFATRGRR